MSARRKRSPRPRPRSQLWSEISGFRCRRHRRTPYHHGSGGRCDDNGYPPPQECRRRYEYMSEMTPIGEMPSRVFTIPASAPFLPTLIKALTASKLGFAVADDPLALAAATLYLPTRRACRLMRDAFLGAQNGDAAILPRIVAIGDIDEDEIAFSEVAAGDIAADALALPPALGGLERRLLLTQLVHNMGFLAGAPRRERYAAGRPDAGRGMRACRRSGAADRRHDDARGVRGIGSTIWCRTNSTPIGSSRCGFCRSRANCGRTCCANREPSSRRRGVIC